MCMPHAEMSSLVWPACFYICQQEALSTLILEIQKDKPKTFHRKHNTWRDGNLKLNIVIFPVNHFSTSRSYHLQKRGIIQLTVFLQNLNQRLASSREQLSAVSQGSMEIEKEQWSGTVRGFSLLGERQEAFGACSDLLSGVVRARMLTTKSIIDSEIFIGKTFGYHFCTTLGTAQDVLRWPETISAKAHRSIQGKPVGEGSSKGKSFHTVCPLVLL